jgi:hypothetical protein
MGNIDGINMNGKCLRIFSESLQEFLGSGIVNNDGKNLMPGWHGKNDRRSHVTTPQP